MAHENGPLVTAVVPVYNHEKYVVESITSLIRQTYNNIELIVINDGSRDKSHELILPLLEECKRRFVRFEYINRENRGLAATLNQALGMAKGAYFTILASDDVALPEKTETLVTALLDRDQTYAVAFGDALFIDEEGHSLVQNEDGSITPLANGGSQLSFLDFYSKTRRIDYKSDAFGTYKSLLKGNYLPAMSNMVKTECLVEVQGWTEGNIIEDWDMWLKLARKYKFARVDDPVALYRWHALNTVKTASTAVNCACYALIGREREFCSTRELLPVWKDSYRTYARRLVCDPTVPLSRRMRILKSADLLNWSKSLVKWVAGK